MGSAVATHPHSGLRAKDAAPRSGRAGAVDELVALLRDRSVDPAARERRVVEWACARGDVEEIVRIATVARRVLADGAATAADVAGELDRLLVPAVRAVTARTLRSALTDPLTGLRTRRALTDELDAALAAADRSGSPLTVVLADVDGLKQVNDSAGHQAGDDVLRAFGAAVRRCLRGSDTGYRFGGDEILVVLPETGGDVVDGLRERLAAAGAPAASIGWATYPTEATTPSSLLEVADRRLYDAKRARRRHDARPHVEWRVLTLSRVVAAVATLTAAGSLALTGYVWTGQHATTPPTHTASGSAVPSRGGAVGPGAAGQHRGAEHPASSPPSVRDGSRGIVDPVAGPVVPAVLPTLVPTAVPTAVGVPTVPASVPPVVPSPSPEPSSLVSTIENTVQSLLCTLVCQPST